MGYMGFYLLIAVIFLVGYTAIALERILVVDKAASALITGTLCWVVLALGSNLLIDIGSIPSDLLLKLPRDLSIAKLLFVVEYQFLEHLAEIASILFFLLGAMAIVEVIDSHNGFSTITDRIVTKRKSVLMWIICGVTFFLSALLDNLTTAIVMVSLLRKLLPPGKLRWIFASLVVISANSGGAWSPMGDVTTTMLWIANKISAHQVVVTLILPSLISAIVPLLLTPLLFRKEFSTPLNGSSITVMGDSSLLVSDVAHAKYPTTTVQRNLVFFVGIVGLISIPVLKVITHLPPAVGMLLVLGILWVITDILHRNKASSEHLSLFVLVKRVDNPGIFFFLGILLAVGALQSSGHLSDVGLLLKDTFSTDTVAGIFIINILLGILSAIVDNVPLVSGAMGMYPVSEGFFATDGLFWSLLSFCAGTGGSVLIIGSAAGIAVMGIEKIDFIWYVKHIAALAASGYIMGVVTYGLQVYFLG